MPNDMLIVWSFNEKDAVIIIHPPTLSQDVFEKLPHFNVLLGGDFEIAL